MADEVFTLIAGGKAGYGIRKAGTVAAALFARMGRHVFQMDDYPSLIRGGHNFCAVSTAPGPITSHYTKADLLVCLDQRSVDAHASHLSERGVMVHDDKAKADEGSVGLPISAEAKQYADPELITGVAVAAALAAAIGMSESELAGLIEQSYSRGNEENVPYARTIYKAALPALKGWFRLNRGEKERPLLSGNEAIALGAVAGGLDIFFAYPMTPASSILHFLAARAEDLGVVAVHPENEIGVINMAIGAATAGARAMVASSGGGFALMQEAFSLAGMAEVPLLCVLSSRPGPSTGLPTYTSQGDLSFALNQGHGEFPRVVASPGSVEEAYRLTAELLGLAWEFQTPAILLTEKHLSESRVTAELETGKVAWAEPVPAAPGPYRRYLDAPTGVSPLLFPPSSEIVKWNSYEHDENGTTTEDAGNSTRMADKRRRKGESLADHLRTLHTVNAFGDKGPVIMTYGSTTLSVLEALRHGGIEATVVQPVFLEPLPWWELSRYAGRNVTVVEQSSTGMFASLLKEKAGIVPARVIKRYDGRPFAPEELAAALKAAE
ncbi:2-oxoacid:acceptor oxidoreductase subunit alpha [candidate division WOR-3 bacterium]|nr:2-oxoacid:acceptor oxidoreductase subunit alpha [candidate division WOR-3 bacterium]